MAHPIFKILAKPIFLILLLAMVLRLWGITYGSPLFLINDETPHVYGALKMIELKTLVPALHQEEFSKVLYYPPLLSYFFLIALSPVIGVHWLFSGMPPLAEYKLSLALDPSFIWLAARILVALLGVLDVVVVYLFTRRIFQSERAATFAALFLTLSFYHIQLSHNVRHWLPAAFLLTLIWFFSVTIFEGVATRKRFIYLGALVGAAAGGVNTAAVIGLIPPFFANIFHQRAPGTPRFQAGKLAFFFLSFALVVSLFIAIYPYGFTRAEGAANPSADVAGRFVMLSQKSFYEWIGFLSEYARALWNFETPLFLIGTLGLGLLFWRRSWFWPWTFVIYAFSFFTLLYLFDDFTVRGIIFVMPLFAVFAGYASGRLREELESRILQYSAVLKYSGAGMRWLVSLVFFVVLFGWQLATDIRYDWLLSQDDTRLVAAQWIGSHIPAGSKIVMDSQYMRLINTKEGIHELRAIDSSALRAADTALLSLPEERYPAPAYGVVNLNFVSRETRATFSPDFFRQKGFQYVVVEYANFNDIAADTRPLMEEATLLRHFSQWEVAHKQSFDGSGKLGRLSFPELLHMKRFGYFVDVYEL